MKKKVIVFTTSLVLVFGLGISLTDVLATCPTTDCSTDCAEGKVCGITQYDTETGLKCSTTYCWGRGPDWNEQ